MHSSPCDYSISASDDLQALTARFAPSAATLVARAETRCSAQTPTNHASRGAHPCYQAADDATFLIGDGPDQFGVDGARHLRKLPIWKAGMMANAHLDHGGECTDGLPLLALAIRPLRNDADMIVKQLGVVSWRSFASSAAASASPTSA
eukprot:CAMPEP_0115866536 /NCGR_PEP_ID=MMETSP0287-20121206/20300_1 /TAXON_ID=412157 /ORGANISM="Chrysochromulina rotalis, Strain UIO044" /LENGTH=148 /DNA_ID=CAMNT_0003321107 /DNA_START=166 /DNA_END=615 /DNA_ORIENTATION=-